MGGVPKAAPGWQPPVSHDLKATSDIMSVLPKPSSKKPVKEDLKATSAFLTDKAPSNPPQDDLKSTANIMLQAKVGPKFQKRVGKTEDLMSTPDIMAKNKAQKPKPQSGPYIEILEKSEAPKPRPKRYVATALDQTPGFF